MKLRIKGNSIRLRLLRSEVERFAAEGRISDEISFGGNALRYTLLASDTAATHAAMGNGEITITIPQNTATEWTISDQVGIEAEHPIGEGKILSILIEKDFVCVGRPDDPDRADAFSAT
ncbi:MAG TPA: hypothetical protein VJV05_11730 [Pyrinomonadaceae bacterium]|nr:hypothetical protein [Pyrinomonadaceae bacterium]